MFILYRAPIDEMLGAAVDETLSILWLSTSCPCHFRNISSLHKQLRRRFMLKVITKLVATVFFPTVLPLAPAFGMGWFNSVHDSKCLSQDFHISLPLHQAFGNSLKNEVMKCQPAMSQNHIAGHSKPAGEFHLFKSGCSAWWFAARDCQVTSWN